MTEKFRTYLLNGIPAVLWRRVKMLAAYKDMNVKDLILSVLEAEVESHSDIV